MKKVWIVTSGIYSDYEIEAVFSSRELAEAYVEKFKEVYSRDDVRVEEYDLDKPKEKWVLTEVTMSKEGEVLSVWKMMCGSWNLEPGFQRFDHEGNLEWIVVTEDEKRAIKVVAEKRAIILAHNAWGDDEKVKEIFSS